ncbi:MAG: hypothetical protein ACOCQR_00190 [bacterium]
MIPELDLLMEQIMILAHYLAGTFATIRLVVVGFKYLLGNLWISNDSRGYGGSPSDGRSEVSIAIRQITVGILLIYAAPTIVFLIEKLGNIFESEMIINLIS